MNKISSNDASALLKQAGAAIRSLTGERDQLREKLAAKEKGERIEKIARDMEEKGLQPELSYEEKRAALARAEDLKVTEEAVKLAAPQNRILGNLSDQPGDGATSAFENFILTGESAE